LLLAASHRDPLCEHLELRGGVLFARSFPLDPARTS